MQAVPTVLMSNHIHSQGITKEPLIYFVHLFTILCLQQCDMGDASRGSLSSYAYIIMMIYYLQQCDPPVLPVLQEVGYII